MLDPNRNGRIDPKFIQATVLSIVVHGLAAMMLVMIMKGKTDLSRRHFETITVEIASIESARETVRPDMARPVRASIRVAGPENMSKPDRPPAPIAPPKEMKTSALGTSPLQIKTAVTLSADNSGRQSQGLSPLPTETLQARADVNSSARQVPMPAKPQPQAANDQKYMQTLKTLIESRKEYPLMARKGGMEGTVNIGCLISREGELIEARVVSSSGISILDKAALRTVRSVGRFPPVPPDLKGVPYSFVAPIAFRLSGD
jgi:protein TonB